MSVEHRENNPQEALEAAQRNVNDALDNKVLVQKIGQNLQDNPFRAEAVLQEGALQIAEWVKVKDLPGYDPNYRPDTPNVIYINSNSPQTPPQDLNRGGSDPLNRPQGPTSQEMVRELKQRASSYAGS